MVTFTLIGINLVVSLLAFSAFRTKRSPERFLFAPARVAGGENLSGMVLSQFSHADLGHLFFNMLALYFFAPVVEHFLGGFGLLTIYLLSGIAATLLTFVVHKKDQGYRALGASGSISGVIFASIVLYPGMSLYLFFVPIPIPGPIFAVGYIAYSIVMARRQFGNIGHEAHIGGAVAGLLLAGMLSESGFGPLLRSFRDLIP
jgi:membrane associated rhomboid family serine protease